MRIVSMLRQSIWLSVLVAAGSLHGCSAKPSQRLRPYLAARRLQSLPADDAGATEALRSALQDGDWRVTATALQIISTRKLVALSPEVIALMESPSWECRAHAAAAIGILQSEEIAPLVTAIRDSRWEVREEVLIALGRVGTREAARALLTLDSDDEAYFADAHEKALLLVPQNTLAETRASLDAEETQRRRAEEERKRSDDVERLAREQAEDARRVAKLVHEETAHVRAEADRLRREVASVEGELARAKGVWLPKSRVMFAARQPTEIWDDAEADESDVWERDFGAEIEVVAETRELYALVIEPGNIGWVEKDEIAVADALFKSLRTEIARFRKDGEIDQAVRILRAGIDIHTERAEEAWLNSQLDTLEAVLRRRDESERIKSKVPQAARCGTRDVEYGGTLHNVELKKGALTATYFVAPVTVNLVFGGHQAKIAHCILEVLFSKTLQNIVRETGVVKTVTVALVTEWRQTDHFGNASGTKRVTLGWVQIKASTLGKVSLATFSNKLTWNGADAAYRWLRRFVVRLEVQHEYR